MQAETYIQVPLRSRKGEVRAFALVSREDEHRVARYRWHMTARGYVARVVRDATTGKVAVYLLHRELMGLPRTGRELQVDHINRNRLDNRRSNLRVVTPTQQAQNQQAINHLGYSKFRGVQWDSQRRKWHGVVRVQGVRHRSPSTSDELQAAQWARELRIKFMTHAED